MYFGIDLCERVRPNQVESFVTTHLKEINASWIEMTSVCAIEVGRICIDSNFLDGALKSLLAAILYSVSARCYTNLLAKICAQTSGKCSLPLSISLSSKAVEMFSRGIMTSAVV